MLADIHDLALTVSSPAALDRFERALAAFRTYRGDPIAALDEAIALDPGFGGAHSAKALILMTFFERRFAADALAALAAGEAALEKSTPRERAWARAARELANGDWHGGVQTLDRVLVEHPRDILALQVAHLIDFNRGDALNLRNRVTRVLPHWSPSMPGYPFVIGMHAFGLEECNQYPEAEAAGMLALSLAPEDCWSVHAVVHVMEMQGRVDEGAGFLAAREGDWAAPDNGFAFHNWWHLALFRIDRGDHAGALDVYDNALAGAHAMAMSRLDATSLLWRLQLEGADVGDRFNAVADAWETPMEGEGGYYAFYDFHAALAFAAAGRDEAMRRLRGRLEAAAWEKNANGEMSRVVGIDLVDGIAAFAQGDGGRAIDRLSGARDVSSRFGGSHAQRDVVTLTLIEAARRARQPRLAAHYLSERLVSRPGNRWGTRLLKRMEATT